jgi:hypothetical protein
MMSVDCGACRMVPCKKRSNWKDMIQSCWHNIWSSKDNFGVYGGNHITTLEEENVHHERKVAMTLESRQCFQMHVKNIL